MLLKEIAQYLHDNGLGTFDETGVNGDIFINVMPDTPNECISLYQNAGIQADPNNEYRQPAVQIIVRSTPGDPRGAIEKSQSVLDILNGVNSKTLITGGVYVVDCIAQQSAPAGIGTDSNNRYEFSFNFLIEYQK